MIFRRSLVRELTATAIALFVVLLGILFVQSVIRILARAAGGAVATEGILALIGFNAMFYLNLLLSVALFLTVLLTLSRWYRDSEMVVWFTSGQSLTACLKPILLFAAPFLVAIILLSLFLSPWAEQRRMEYERQLESREEISIISPGLFREFKRAGIVVYVESINPVDGRIRNVFLHSVDDAQDATTVARLGHLVEEPNGDRFVVLEDGRRYEGKPGAADFRLIEFERLGRRIEPAEARALPASNKAIPTAVLLVADGRGERAELFWRLSVPILALVLTLLAIPLSFVNPRMGRSFNLVAAAFLYMLYTNCINIVQSMIAQGTLTLWVGLLVPHLAALAVVFLLFRHQLSITGLFGRAPRADPA
ncbi:MAG: LPS export ABC transporter permease LptF [Casimicrobiaceae bacterium]